MYAQIFDQIQISGQTMGIKKTRYPVKLYLLLKTDLILRKKLISDLSHQPKPEIVA